jgi:hypothetical protein
MDPTKIDGAFPSTNILNRTGKIDFSTRVDPAGTSPTHLKPEANSKTSSTPIKPAEVASSQYVDADTYLPIEILKETRIATAESAWRNLLLTVVQSMAKSATSDVSKTSVQNQENELSGMDLPVHSSVEEGTKTLWSLLATASHDTAQVTGQTSWKGTVPDSTILPFRLVNHDMLEKQNKTVQHWVVQDRLVSSVQTTPYERSGAGLFFPPPIHSEQSTQQAVRWRAARQTKVGSNGRMVHRIQFEMMLGTDPVKCSLTCALPTLLLHFETNNERLRLHLSAGKDIIQPLLSRQGYELHQWTVSHIEDSEGAQS